MPVPTSLADLSATAASNSPAGADAIGASLDDYLRAIQSILKRVTTGVDPITTLVFEGSTDDGYETTLAVADPTADRTVTIPDMTGTVALMARGSDIASSGTINLTTATGDIVDVTGTTTITAITLADGIERTVRFTGALTLTHGASLILPTAANITTAAGDVATFRGYASSVVRCTGYQRASGQALVSSAGITLGTPVASTSGTAIDFTGIPSTAKRVSVHLLNVSTSGTSDLLIQIGSGSVATSGYSGAGTRIPNGVPVTVASSAGFITTNGVASREYTGTMMLSLSNSSSNKWTGFGVFSDSTNPCQSLSAGTKALSGTIDRVRITTVGGTDTFDAGEINITYE